MHLTGELKSLFFKKTMDEVLLERINAGVTFEGDKFQFAT